MNDHPETSAKVERSHGFTRAQGPAEPGSRLANPKGEDPLTPHEVAAGRVSGEAFRAGPR
jgi:hypothetical protein